MTTDKLEALAKEIKEYEQISFGQKFGPDFPEIAKHLISTHHFPAQEFALLTVTSLAGGRILAKLADIAPSIGGSNEEFMRQAGEAMRGSFIEGMMLEMFYWGYRAGKQNAEIQQLENIASK